MKLEIVNSFMQDEGNYCSAVNSPFAYSENNSKITANSGCSCDEKFVKNVIDTALADEISYKVNVVSSHPEKYAGIKGVTAYKTVKSSDDVEGNIFLPSLLAKSSVIDKIIDHVSNKKGKFMVCACLDLYETGTVDSTYKMPPITLLDRMGLLENSIVVGCNYIDGDDLELMAMRGATAVFLPTYSMGKGYGIPPVKFAFGKVKIGLGTGDNSYNVGANVGKEASLVRFVANAENRKERTLTDEQLLQTVGHGDISKWKNLIG